MPEGARPDDRRVSDERLTDALGVVATRSTVLVGEPPRRYRDQS
jgi:hypothetical protein